MNLSLPRLDFLMLVFHASVFEGLVLPDLPDLVFRDRYLLRLGFLRFFRIFPDSVFHNHGLPRARSCQPSLSKNAGLISIECVKSGILILINKSVFKQIDVFFRTHLLDSELKNKLTFDASLI